MPHLQTSKVSKSGQNVHTPRFERTSHPWRRRGLKSRRSAGPESSCWLCISLQCNDVILVLSYFIEDQSLPWCAVMALSLVIALGSNMPVRVTLDV